MIESESEGVWVGKIEVWKIAELNTIVIALVLHLELATKITNIYLSFATCILQALTLSIT